MINAISNTVQPQIEPAAQPAKAAAQPGSNQVTQQAPVTDTVQLSSGAKAALQELSETPTQTAKEAASGDAQARRLLAKETHH
jgi:Ribonuclease G/E